MRAYRIGSLKHADTAAKAFSGEGGLHGDGRWHHRGRRIIYAAEHLSLAMLEILVHLDATSGIQPYVSWVIEVPTGAWKTVRDLPPDWRERVERTRSLGDAWLESGSPPVLSVPSAVVPGERNCLINPRHPEFSLAWIVSGPEPVTFDPRLTRSG